MDDINTKKWLSDDIFIFFKDNKPYLWDYAKHQQFEITTSDFHRLTEFAKGSVLTDRPEDRSINAAEILLDSAPRSSWGWDILSKIFHIGTSHPNTPTPADPSKHIEYAQSYLEFCQSIADTAPDVQRKKGGIKTLLPPPDFTVIRKASLWDTLVSRRTCRDFYDVKISLAALSTLLAGTLGAVDHNDYDAPFSVQRFGYKRTSPAAGGLQVTDGYVWIRKVEGIEQGIYHYVSTEHYLEKVSDLPSEPLSTYLCNQHWCDDMAFSIFLVSKMDILWWKYPHSRAYRPMLIDTGHLSQTFNLLATAIGLQSWITGYFHDKEINELLQLNTPQEQVIFLIGAGKGSGSAYDRIVRNLLDEA